MDAKVRHATEFDADVQPARRAWLRRVLLWGLPLLVVAVSVWFYGSGGRYVSTDNAYVKQDRIDVAAQMSGDVREVRAVENARVRAGDTILVLDDALPRVAVQRAEAQLAAARADVLALQAAYREKQGQLAVAKRSADYALREYDRQANLARQKLVPASQLDVAHRSADIATGTIGVLELQVAQTAAKLAGDPHAPIDRHPAVMQAAAELERVRIDLARTEVKAPQAGVVSHLPKVGDHVDVGRPAFAIVTDRTVWVEANFKETDLEWVRPGQPVSVVIDTYPSHRWPGRVESISQATGAEFSVLPPQNASGNWVKVVQRIPVRIALQSRADDPPLRNGMSADVEIDTGPHSRFDRWFGRGR
jgi:membrane fusion protein (multidrug efflux system)